MSHKNEGFANGLENPGQHGADIMLILDAPNTPDLLLSKTHNSWESFTFEISEQFRLRSI